MGIRSQRKANGGRDQCSRTEIIVMIVLLLATLLLAFPMD